MIGAFPRNGRRQIPKTVGFNRIDRNVVLFLGLLCFLIFWSFCGNGIEKAVYDQRFPGYNAYGDVGMKIVVSASSGSGPLVEVLSTIFMPTSP